MLIKNEQQEVFKENALKKFEDEMIEHVKDFFPNHFSLMHEDGIRRVTRCGYENAKKYSLISQRNVCSYINNMLLLGSHFDTDPQYPWASEILNDKNKPDPNTRIDEVSDKTLDFFEKISGVRHLNIYRAALNMKNNSKSIFETLINGNFKNIGANLNNLFPKKYEATGEVNIKKLADSGVISAMKYGIKDESCLMIYILFMFSMGSGFDRDPQHPWAAEILNNPAIKFQRDKMEMLYNKAVNILKDFLSKYNQ